MCQRRHLIRAFETTCGPLGPEGRSLIENTPFGGFSTGLRRLNQLAAVAEFRFLADWPLYSPNLNSLDFSTGSAGRPKGQAMPHTNLAALHPSVATEYRQLAAYRSAKHAAPSAAAIKPSLRKMKLKLNGWLAKGLAHTKQYFSGLI
jgi:hypothetical protein